MFKKIKKLLLNKNLENEKGSIAAMVVGIIIVSITLASSISLIEMVNSDSLILEYQQDAVQEELLLRSEAARTHMAVEYNEMRPIPNREVEIISNSNDRRTVYKIENSKENIFVNNYMGYATKKVVSIKSHITARRGRSYQLHDKSPVERLSEKLISHESLAEFQYFTDVEASENADGGQEAAAVKFYGKDVLYGKVHSNDDIWIQQAGGGNNNGWPTFYEMVTTSGKFKRYPSGEDLIGSGVSTDEIFVGGFEEEVPPIVFSATMTDIRDNADRFFGNTTTSDIGFVYLNGGSYQGLIGDKYLVDIMEFPVYSWYPSDAGMVQNAINDGVNWFEDSELIWTNSIAIYDTVWTPRSGAVNNNSVFVDGKLYIYGRPGGKQTWGASDTVFVVSDIVYYTNELGDFPDGYAGLDEEGEPQYDLDEVNPTDFFGLVSEEDILIAYKYKNPETGEIIDHNCDGIYLYGAFAAIGKGDEDIHAEMACHHDGIFSFEYHHPAGSTPNFHSISPYLMETYTLKMIDSSANGWENATIDLYVNGELREEDLTCTGSETDVDFNLEHMDILDLIYTPGDAGHENEHSYQIVDSDGNIVVAEGPNPAQAANFQCVVTEFSDTLYTYIDLHKYVYPPNPLLPEEHQGFNLQSNGLAGGGYPYGLVGYPFESSLIPTAYVNSYPNAGPNFVYPDGTDIPWYNPIWPEPSTSVGEDVFYYDGRNARIYGAIAQRRRGFIRRSGTDPYNHPNPLDTDEKLYHYGRTHDPTGYDKEYYYDRRFLFEQPPDYPEIYRGWGSNDITSFTSQTWYFKPIGD